MPRERIHDESHAYDVDVSWKPDNYVQVGTRTRDDKSLAQHLNGNGQTAEDFTGLYGTFDRAGINRLIRALRRARDSVFGRDE